MNNSQIANQPTSSASDKNNSSLLDQTLMKNHQLFIDIKKIKQQKLSVIETSDEDDEGEYEL